MMYDIYISSNGKYYCPMDKTGQLYLDYMIYWNQVTTESLIRLKNRIPSTAYNYNYILNERRKKR